MANFFFRISTRVLIVFILPSILFSACTSNEIEIPEYQKYDWYAHYTVDGNEHTLKKDGDNSTIKPYVTSSKSYGFSLLPDSTENILFVTMDSGISSVSLETNNQLWFAFQIVTDNQQIIGMKDLSKDEKLNILKGYLTGRHFVHTPENRINGEFIDLRLQDKSGNFYINNLFNNGTYAIILDYEIKVLSASIISHEEHGNVIQLTMDFKAEVEDSKRNLEFTVVATTKTFLIAPFE